MTITMFLLLLTFGSAVASLLTEAIKKFYSNAKKKYSANFIAAVVSVLVGGLGTIAAYFLMGINFTAQNIICVALMIVCVWVGAMVGYDKVIQLVAQLGAADGKNK